MSRYVLSCSPFLLQVPSSLRIGPEVTIKIADVFRKESYIEFASGCQSTFCYTKNFPSINHFAIRIPSELHKVDGMKDGRKNDKGSSRHLLLMSYRGGEQ